MNRLIVISCGAAMLAACNSSSRDAGDAGSAGVASAGPGPGSGTSDGPAPGDTGVEGSTGAPGTTDGGNADTDAIKFDLGSGTAGPPGGPGCEKVDFLFVIDNSGSMTEEQANLVASFPGFIDAIRNTLTAQDYRILVTDTDTGSGGGFSNSICGMGDCCANTCGANPLIVCNGIPCPNTDCDTKLGAGRRDDLGGGTCGVAGSNRFITHAQPNLDQTFACLAEVGIDGNGDEIQMTAMSWAVSPELVDPGGCNAGFLRDDAILVVTVITDEEDQRSLGDPVAWKQALVDAKLGNEAAIVMLGLIGDNDQPGAICQATEAQASPRLRQFVQQFGPQGHLGSVCAADYTPFFLDAVSTIDTTCDEFQPPG